MMTRDREIRAEDRETLGDEHTQAKSSLSTSERSAHLGRWIVNSYKAVAIVTLNIIILFACFELAATGLDKMRKEPEPVRDEDLPRAHVSYYASQAWATQYWNEFSLSRKQLYRPYVIWRRGPFTGNFININEDGIRLTPGSDCDDDSYKVFTFGGSTMWGTGAPDWGTIPAYLEADFAALLRKPVCMMNFGESAFNSTQGVIQLMLQLQSGNIPDLVIFYDGINDTYGAYQSGRPTHHNFTRIAEKFQKAENPPPSFLDWIISSNTFGLLQRLETRWRKNPQEWVNLLNYKTMGVDPETLSESIVELYVGNYKIVGALAREYGFKHLFFWQPFIAAGTKSLTAEEQEMKRGMAPDLRELYEAVYHRVQSVAKKYEHIYYIANVFDEYEPLLWIDIAHVTPDGNRLIAQRMLQTFMSGNP